MNRIEISCLIDCGATTWHHVPPQDIGERPDSLGYWAESGVASSVAPEIPQTRGADVGP